MYMKKINFFELSFPERLKTKCKIKAGNKYEIKYVPLNQIREFSIFEEVWIRIPEKEEINRRRFRTTSTFLVCFLTSPTLRKKKLKKK
jgi:hypothetical protein